MQIRFQPILKRSPLPFFFILIMILVVSWDQCLGQSRGINRDTHRIHIFKITGAIDPDGVLNEPEWQLAEKAGDFRRVLPTDTGYAAARTEVRLLYNSTTLFVGVTCFDPTPGDRPVESFRRDFQFAKNDNFIVFIDTYNDQTNGFAFGISPAGAQWDGIQANGGKVNLDWDMKWWSGVENHKDRWTAEFAIPLRSLRYKGEAPEWGINFSRQDLKTSEKSSWAPMPRQFATATLAYTGSLVWDSPLPSSSGPRLTLVPFLTARAIRQTSGDAGIVPTLGAGLDTKMILSTSLNLDVTLLPDYSQVEVDRQQTLLDRYELFFPEKRQFFLENSDLFANLGMENVRPFFSRRIGLNAPVLAGARLTGQIGEDWRIGIMNLQTRAQSAIDPANFLVTTIQRKIFRQSSLSAFLVNKQVSGSQFNRVAGTEFNLASKDNRWTGKAFYHQSFTPAADSMASSAGAILTYSTPFLTASLSQSLVGRNFSSEMGYIRRKGYYEITPLLQYKFFPANGRIANHGPGIKADMYTDPTFVVTDRDVQLFYQIEWLQKSLLLVDIKNSFLTLQFPFDPTQSGAIPYNTGESFQWTEGGISFSSDIRKPFNYLISTRYGGYFGGNRLIATNELYYRIQPYASLAVISTWNRIRLPSPHASRDYFLIGPRLDITLSEKFFITTLVQYNNQISNINLNLRLQWRFAPGSDLYLVYTENNSPLDFRVKDRGIVLKVSYWIN